MEEKETGTRVTTSLPLGTPTSRRIIVFWRTIGPTCLQVIKLSGTVPKDLGNWSPFSLIQLKQQMRTLCASAQLRGVFPRHHPPMSKETCGIGPIPALSVKLPFCSWKLFLIYISYRRILSKCTGSRGLAVEQTHIRLQIYA